MLLKRDLFSEIGPPKFYGLIEGGGQEEGLLLGIYLHGFHPRNWPQMQIPENGFLLNGVEQNL